MKHIRIYTLALLAAVLYRQSYGQASIPWKETKPDYWNEIGQRGIEDAVRQFENLNKNKAKNVILFLGDGMSLSTVVAGRILKGQRNNPDSPGEETMTSLDEMPHAGLLKTYSVDHQTPDSAATATAFLCGFKTRSGLLGVPNRSHKACSSLEKNRINSILEHSADAEKSTGIITNTRVQHATPAGAYAKSQSRSWYSDDNLPYYAKKNGCKDIAKQLVEMGSKINVVMGGGRAHMRPRGTIDEEYSTTKSRGRRLDGRDLIDEWISTKPDGKNAKYVWNKRQFKDIDPATTDYLLGLFDPYEMHYALNRDQDPAGEPSLPEMTEKAIKILQKNEKGFFLLVESGLIDKAHHGSKAHYALEEFLELERTVELAKTLTSDSDTLIIVTADHGHVFTIGGGTTKRGNPLFGLSPSVRRPVKAKDGKYFTSLNYANGPGHSSVRQSINEDIIGDINYIFQSAVPLPAESHSAEDVVAFASGPMAHMIHGVHEQNYLAHVMMYASCVGINYHKWEHCQTRSYVKAKLQSVQEELTDPQPWEDPK